MTPRRFAWILRARGPDLSAWPATDRAAAAALLRADVVSRTLLADTLAADAADDADDAGLCRMQAVLRRALAPATPLLRAVRWSALAACMAAGLYLGLPAAEPEYAAWAAPTTEATIPATVLAALDP